MEGEGELQLSDVFDGHPGGHARGDLLDHLGRVLAKDVSADDLASFAFDDQFAAALQLSVGDGAQRILVARRGNRAVGAGTCVRLVDPTLPYSGSVAPAGTMSWTRVLWCWWAIPTAAVITEAGMLATSGARFHLRVRPDRESVNTLIADPPPGAPVPPTCRPATASCSSTGEVRSTRSPAT